MIRHDNVRKYVMENILPIYEQFDKGHGVQHIQDVITKTGNMVADNIAPDIDPLMVYVIAAYHDVGRIYDYQSKDDENIHELESARIFRADKFIWKHFSDEEMTIMAEAIEDHRASRKEEPRSIYGKIIADGDRNIDYENILERCLEYSLRKDPNYTVDERYKYILNHITSKYGKGGYLKLWLNYSDDVKRLEEVRTKLSEPISIINDINKIWINLNGGEKILL